MANRITKVKKLREKWDKMKAEQPKRFNEIVRRIKREQAANRRKRIERKMRAHGLRIS